MPRNQSGLASTLSFATAINQRNAVAGSDFLRSSTQAHIRNLYWPHECVSTDNCEPRSHVLVGLSLAPPDRENEYKQKNSHHIFPFDP